VVISGGGGIPVVRDSSGILTGIDAVIDKDLGAQVIARETGANVLLILTDVAKRGLLITGMPEEKKLGAIPLDEMKAYYQQDHFKAGSMGPKVFGSNPVYRGGGDKAVITSLENALLGAEGKIGTVITR